MKTIYRRRRHLRSSKNRFISLKKDNQQEQVFFGDPTNDSFFHPVAVVQRKSVDDQLEEKQLQREPKEKEEELVQKKEMEGNHENDTNITAYIHSLNGRGSPLPTKANQFFSSKMGYNFSGVRIHTDHEAAQSARNLNAKAYTFGEHIVFNEGQYNHESNKGNRLLAHELTHVVQQSNGSNSQIQRSWLGNTWKTVKRGVKKGVSTVGGAVKSAAGWVGDKASGAANSISKVWNTATSFLGSAASKIWSGVTSLGKSTIDWLSKASSSVWNAIKWFGARAWDGIKFLGSFLWEKLSILGENVWSFLSNTPIRFWRMIVHGWEGIKGVLGWMLDGLKGAAGHIWQGIVGFFKWVGSGLVGAINWLFNGISAGYNWAIDFVKNPSLTKLWDGLISGLSWIWGGFKGFVKWGWNGIVGAVIWVWGGIKGFASWIWDGVIAGLEWAGRLLMYVLDLVGFWEGLQILWGLIFRMRKLTQDEIHASLEVHPPGMIPYHLIRVDEGSLVAYISGYFSGGGYRAVTTTHILHVAPSERIDTMVHELSHVAQYEHVGSVYMAEAIHAQAFGAGYDYINSDGTFKHKHFNEFNREQQAQICQDYYRSLHGIGSAASTTALQPLINEMRLGRF